MIEKVCPHCGERYETGNKQKIYCSPGCQQAATAARKKAARRMLKRCPICMRRFKPHQKTQKYCSIRCAGLASRGVSRPRRSTIPAERCRIRITAEVPVFPEYRPVKGRIYEAERSLPEYTRVHPYWIVEIGGKRIVVRDGEAEEV